MSAKQVQDSGKAYPVPWPLAVLNKLGADWDLQGCRGKEGHWGSQDASTTLEV